VGAFKELNDARQCFLKIFVKPFFKIKGKKVEDYFKFDVFNPKTTKEWSEILETFVDSGSIEKVKLK
jgi:hypothetical protein